MNRKLLGCKIVGSAALVVCLMAPIRASGQTDFTMGGNVYNNTLYQQTSNAPGALTAYWFAIGANAANGGVYDTATATYPGPGSPLDLPAAPGTANTSNASFTYSTSLYSSEADLHSDFPYGTYTIAASGASGSVQTNIDYAADYFAATVPYLTNFDELNGMNPSVGLSVNFPAYTPDSHATEGFIFFTVFDSGGNAVVSNGFLDSSSTSAPIPANSLLPNTDYTFELDYSDRIDGQDPINNQYTEQGFDLRDDGAFTTGSVPSPSTGAEALGLFLPALISRKRKAK